MDLLNVLRTLRRFKWTTLAIVGLTLGAIAFLVFAVPKVYQVDAAYVLVNPSLPTDAEMAARPELANENRNNPYLRFSSQAMVGQVVATRMESDDVRRDLHAQGISDEYVVAPSNDFGGAGQILTVSGVGPTPEAASHATAVIVSRMSDELRTMQKVYGANDKYLITQIPVQAPGEAKRVVSGQLRSVIAVGGVGLVVLFAAISIRQAMEARPKRPPTASASPPEPGSDGPLPVPAPTAAVMGGGSADPLATAVPPGPPPVPQSPAIRPAPVLAAGPAQPVEPVVQPVAPQVVQSVADPLVQPVVPPVQPVVPPVQPVVQPVVRPVVQPVVQPVVPQVVQPGGQTAKPLVQPARTPAMRLVRNGTRSLHLADDLDAVSSFRQQDHERDHVRDNERDHDADDARDSHPDQAPETDLPVPRAAP